MILSARNKLYLAMILMAALTALCGFAAWYAFGLIVKESDEVVKLQTEQSLIDRQRGQLSEMTKNYDAMKDFIPQLDSVLLDVNDKLEFIMLVERLSAQASVDHVIEAVGGATAVKPAGAETVKFNINIIGDFPNILKFIYTLENAPYYVNIERIQLSSDGSKFSSGQSLPGTGGVKAQMLVKVYSK